MKVEKTQNGDLMVDPTELADRFGISMDDLRRFFSKGLVTSMVERGEGSHAGTCRLSVKLGNRVWRAIVNSENCVMSEETTFYRANSRMPTNAPDP